MNVDQASRQTSPSVNSEANNQRQAAETSAQLLNAQQAEVATAPAQPDAGQSNGYLRQANDNTGARNWDRKQSSNDRLQANPDATASNGYQRQGDGNPAANDEQAVRKPNGETENADTGLDLSGLDKKTQEKINDLLDGRSLEELSPQELMQMLQLLLGDAMQTGQDAGGESGVAGGNGAGNAGKGSGTSGGGGSGGGSGAGGASGADGSSANGESGLGTGETVESFELGGKTINLKTDGTASPEEAAEVRKTMEQEYASNPTFQNVISNIGSDEINVTLTNESNGNISGIAEAPGNDMKLYLGNGGGTPTTIIHELAHLAGVQHGPEMEQIEATAR